jgi:hypothetical protein
MHEKTSDTLEKIRTLVTVGNVLISNHGFEPAVLITAYRPDPALWEDDFRARRSSAAT